MGWKECYSACEGDKQPDAEFAMRDALHAINAVHKALGAPGDFGYGTKEGMALQWLYAATKPLGDCLNVGAKEVSDVKDDPKFDSWFIVEVMGHNRFAGRVTEQQIGGASFIRVDVPAVEGKPAFTKLLGAASIFAITPCTQSTAQAAAKTFRVRPFEMSELQMLPSNTQDDEELLFDS